MDMEVIMDDKALEAAARAIVEKFDEYGHAPTPLAAAEAAIEAPRCAAG